MAPVLMALWQWRKAVLYGAAAITLGVMAWRVSVWHNAYERIGAVESALEAERLATAGRPVQRVRRPWKRPTSKPTRV